MNIVKLSDEELRKLKKDAINNIESYERMSIKEEFKNCEWISSGIELYNNILNKLEKAEYIREKLFNK